MAGASEDERHGHPRIRTGEIKGTGIVIGHGSSVSIGVVIAAGTLGPFVTAFCTELGKRFGGSVADWTSRVHLRRKHSDSTEADLFVEVDGAVTVLELDESLPDEARLALLDLDIKARGVRGHRLMWDAESEAWVSTD